MRYVYSVAAKIMDYLSAERNTSEAEKTVFLTPRVQTKDSVGLHDRPSTTVE